MFGFFRIGTATGTTENEECMTIPLTYSQAEHEEFSVENLKDQIERISRSRAFENSQTLQRLLRYLAAKSNETPGEQIKEYTIGVEALERRPSFDPKEDTIVRVQIHRLREKLLEYYDSEGIRDPIRVTIPKGRYLPNFEAMTLPVATSPKTAPHSRKVITGENSPATNLEIAPSPQVGSRPRFVRTVVLRAAIGMLAAAACFQAGWMLRGQSSGRTGGDRSIQSSSDLPKADLTRTFWADILGNDSAPVIVYTNFLYILDDSGDLFSYPQGAVDNRGVPVDPNLARRYASNPSLIAKAGKVYYESGYTGTGDLEGASVLEHLFARMGLTPTVKSIRDLTTEDLKEHSVIVLGSTLQHVGAEQLVPTGDFVFGNSTERHEGWGTEIINLRPEPTESTAYKTVRDPDTLALRADYGLISIQPGIVPERNIVTLAGSDTTGTEGAALFAASQSGIEAILSKSSLLARDIEKNQVPIFQALVRVNLAKGSEVLNSSLITVHVPPWKSSNAQAPRDRDASAK
jgi:hypothetical protein